jgi:hypothetical protein
MKFGQKKSEAPPLSDNGGMYLRNFKDGDTVVRFLQPTDDWIIFREHYTADRRSFPCTEDRDTCPGCTSEIESVQRASRKYGTNIWLPKNDIVLPFRIPMSLAKRMVAREERNDDGILNRDYVVMKSGKGMDTEYDVEADDKYAVDVASLLTKGMDVQEILSISYEEVWGEAKSSNIVKAAKEPEKVVEPEEFPTETDQSDDDAGSVEELVIDEDALYDMTLVDLKDLAVKAGLKVASNSKKSDVIRALLSSSE